MILFNVSYIKRGESFNNCSGMYKSYILIYLLGEGWFFFEVEGSEGFFEWLWIGFGVCFD